MPSRCLLCRKPLAGAKRCRCTRCPICDQKTLRGAARGLCTCPPCPKCSQYDIPLCVGRHAPARHWPGNVLPPLPPFILATPYETAKIIYQYHPGFGWRHRILSQTHVDQLKTIRPDIRIQTIRLTPRPAAIPAPTIQTNDRNPAQAPLPLFS